MKTYKVVRPHMGDKFYEQGDKRKAKASEVAHLVEKGILAEDDEADEGADDNDEPLTALQRSLAENPLGVTTATIDAPESQIADAVAEALAKAEAEKASAIAQALADADVAAKATLQRALDDQAAEHGRQVAAMTAQLEVERDLQFTIGALTSEQVFKAAGLENLSDLQAVLDAVEVALAAKVEPAPPVADEKSETGVQLKIEPPAKDKADPKVKDKAAG